MAIDGIGAVVHQKQADFLEADELVLCYTGGRGAGKTHVGALKVLTSSRDGWSWMGVSPDSGVIIETTFPTFLAMAEQYGKLIKYVKSPYPRIWFRTVDGGVADIIMRSGEKPDKLRGANKSGLWLDEASIMVRKVLDVTIPTLRHQGRMGQVMMTMTPAGKSHWTFDLLFTRVEDDSIGKFDPSLIREFGGTAYVPKEGTKLVHAKSLDNPFLPEEYVQSIRSLYTDQFARQELEGEFVDIGGLFFSRQNFQFIDNPVREIPYEAARVRYWDSAGTADAGCFTVGLLMARTEDNRYIVEDVVRGQWSQAERHRQIKATAERDSKKYNNSVVIYFEGEGGSGGKEQADQHITMLAGYPVFRDNVSGSQFRRERGLVLPGKAKQTRALPVSAAVENHNIYLVRHSEWNRAFLDELTAFPESANADQVDAFSGAFNKLAFRGIHSVGTPISIKPDEDSGRALLRSHAVAMLEAQESMRRRRGE
tara:strand:+ start:673 stop:2115 length:1443 start_codon:yes stop_codon:yes gene_type:complete